MRNTVAAPMLVSLLLSGVLSVAPPSTCGASDGGTWATGLDFANFGIAGDVHAVCEYQGDVIVAGRFGRAGDLSVNNIARWDGTAWHPLGNGLSATIHSMVVYDGDLYVGGMIDFADGIQAGGLVRWTGSAWDVVIPYNDRGSIINALAVFQDKLVVGGSFESIAGLATVRNLAQWDGSAWSTVIGTGADYDVTALAVYNDQLIIAGRFSKISVHDVKRIARWTGIAVQPLGTGVDDPSQLAAIHDLAVHDGSLIAVGSFSSAGGVAVANLARWNGSSWSAMGEGFDGVVFCAGVHDGELFAGGEFLHSGAADLVRMARWDGAVWQPVGGADNSVRTLVPVGDRLWAGGSFAKAGGLRVNHVSAWNGSAWGRIDGPVGQGVNDDVYAFALHDGELVAAGKFSTAGCEPAWRVARWDGQEWRSIGTSAVGNGSVWTIAVYDGELYAGGDFSSIGGQSVSHIARWNGATWAAVGSGSPDGTVRSLAVYDGNLVAGGSFTGIGGVACQHIASWDGATWAPLGEGLTHPGSAASVYAMTGFAGDLVAVGSFSLAGGDTVDNVARWDGGAWHPMAKGFPTSVDCAAVYQGVLYVGGAFRWSQEGIVAHRVARWDGSTFWPVGGGADDRVATLAVYGNRLIAGGWFTQAGGTAASRIAAWDGERWSPLGSGTNNRVMALAAYDGSLYAGGLFTLAGGNVSSRVAKWTDFPVPVRLLSFIAARVGDKALLRWDIAEPADLAGFHVHREDASGVRAQLTDAPLSGGPAFAFTDRDAPDTDARYWLAEWSRSGEITWHGPVVLEQAARPLAPSVRATGASPARGPARIAYEVPREGRVELAVFDVTGRRVARVVSGMKPAGRFEAVWSGTTNSGASAAAGSYFLRLTTAGGAASSRFVRIP